MAKKKKKRKAPRVKSWIGRCDGVTKEGRIKKGWRLPSEKGGCPRPGKGVGAKRTRGIVSHTKACSPLMRKAVGVGWKRGYTACERALPEDLRQRVEKHKAAAAAQMESSEAAWAMSHGIPTLGGHGKRKRRRSKKGGR